MSLSFLLQYLFTPSFVFDDKTRKTHDLVLVYTLSIILNHISNAVFLKLKDLDANSLQCSALPRTSTRYHVCDGI